VSGIGRERVVQKHDPRGVLCLAFVIGLAVGAALVATERLVAAHLSARPVLGQLLLVHLVVLPFLSYGVMLARLASRVGVFIAAAVIMNLGVFLAGAAISVSESLGFGAQVGLLPWQMLPAFAVTSVMGILCVLATRWLYRSLRYIPVEQTNPPRLCMRCAYEMGEVERCPECGAWRERARPRGAWLDYDWMFVQRWSRPLVVVILLVLAGYASWRIVTDYLPTRTFIRAFDTGRPAYAYIDGYWYQDGVYAPSMGRTIDLNDGTGRMVLVSFNALPPAGLSMMQVRLCAPATLPPGWPLGAERMTDWGLPRTIVADLNRDQAERVLREGLPPGLIDAIGAKADEVGWKPGGGMQNVGGPRLTIDAGPFFAKQVPERE